MIEMDRPIVCAGVRVFSGDTVFGDVDGVVIIPEAVSDKVFAKAHDKATRESRTREELHKGRLLSEVYEKYGVL